MAKVTQQDFDNAFDSFANKPTVPADWKGAKLAYENLDNVTENIVYDYAGFFIPEPDDIDDYDEVFFNENAEDIGDEERDDAKSTFKELMEPFNNFLLENSNDELPTFSKEDKELFEKNKRHLFEIVS